MKRELKLGVVELHSNDALRVDFYNAVRQLPGWTVDVWMMDIAWVLEKHGYHLSITTERPLRVAA